MRCPATSQEAQDWTTNKEGSKNTLRGNHRSVGRRGPGSVIEGYSLRICLVCLRLNQDQHHALPGATRPATNQSPNSRSKLDRFVVFLFDMEPSAPTTGPPAASTRPHRTGFPQRLQERPGRQASEQAWTVRHERCFALPPPSIFIVFFCRLVSDQPPCTIPPDSLHLCAKKMQAFLVRCFPRCLPASSSSTETLCLKQPTGLLQHHTRPGRGGRGRTKTRLPIYFSEIGEKFF